MFEITNQCVDEFVHAEECARIDTNPFKFKKIGDEKHPIRILNHMHWSDRIEMFRSSNECEKHETQFSSLTIGKARSRQFTCPSIKEPTAESCVNMPMDAL